MDYIIGKRENKNIVYKIFDIYSFFNKNHIKNSFFILLLIISSIYCYSDEQNENIIFSNESFIVLRDASILYGFDYIQNMAFLNILESEDSINIFVMLFNESKTNVGKFYALLGLFECNRNIYNEFIMEINLTDRITLALIRSADYFFGEDFATMITMIESGRWMKTFEENGMR
jgi:hypothetical protein